MSLAPAPPGSHEVMATGSRQYATFRIHDLLFGLPVLEVQEVLRHQHLTTVPLASPSICGLLNLRGQIVLAIDTRRSLGMPALSGKDRRANIVIRAEDGTVSLLVDEIGDVIDVPLTCRVDVPETLPAAQRVLIRAIYNLREGVMLVLDSQRLLADACNDSG